MTSSNGRDKFRRQDRQVLQMAIRQVLRVYPESANDAQPAWLWGVSSLQRNSGRSTENLGAIIVVC